MRFLILFILLPFFVLAEEIKLEPQNPWEIIYEGKYDQLNDVMRFYYFQSLQTLPKEWEGRKFPNQKRMSYLEFAKKFNLLKIENEGYFVGSGNPDDLIVIDLHQNPNLNSPVTGQYYAGGILNQHYGGIRYLVINDKLIAPYKKNEMNDFWGNSIGPTELVDHSRFSYQPVLDYKVTKEKDGSEIEWIKLPSYGTGKSLWLSSKYFVPFARDRYPKLMYEDPKNEQPLLYEQVAVPFGLYRLSETKYFDQFLCLEKMENGVMHLKRQIIPRIGPFEIKFGSWVLKDTVLKREKLLNPYFDEVKDYEDVIHKIKLTDYIAYKFSHSQNKKYDEIDFDFMLSQIGYDSSQKRKCDGAYYDKEIPAKSRVKIFTKYYPLFTDQPLKDLGGKYDDKKNKAYVFKFMSNIIYGHPTIMPESNIDRYRPAKEKYD